MSRMDFLYSRTSCGSHLLPSSLCALADFLGLLPRTQPTLASRGVGGAAGQARPAPAFGPGPPVCYDITALAAVLASGRSQPQSHITHSTPTSATEARLASRRKRARAEP